MGRPNPTPAPERTRGGRWSRHIRAAGKRGPWGALAYLSPETVSPGNRGPPAGPAHSPAGAHRAGAPHRRQGSQNPRTAAAGSPWPPAGAPEARGRGAGAGGEGRVSTGPASRCCHGHGPRLHSPGAAAAPGGPGSGIGDPHRLPWRAGACRPSQSQPRYRPAGLWAQPEAAPSQRAYHTPPQASGLPLHAGDQHRRLPAGDVRRVTGWPDLGSDPVRRAHELLSPALPTTLSWAGPAAQQTGPYTQHGAPRHKQVPFADPQHTVQQKQDKSQQGKPPQNWDASRGQLVGLLWAGNRHVAWAHATTQLALGPPQTPPTVGDAAPFIPQLGQETSSRQAQGDSPYPGPYILSGGGKRGTLLPSGLPHHQG